MKAKLYDRMYLASMKCYRLVSFIIFILSFHSCRKWHSMLVPDCSSFSTQIVVTMNGVINSLWQPWASQISLCHGYQTCSCWSLAWWVDLPPEPWPWNPLTVRLCYKKLVSLFNLLSFNVTSSRFCVTNATFANLTNYIIFTTNE